MAACVFRALESVFLGAVASEAIVAVGLRTQTNRYGSRDLPPTPHFQATRFLSEGPTVSSLTFSRGSKPDQ